jgi:polyisoprenoid-binding protein YceI
MIGVPLSGWAMVSASPRNIPTILYGIVPWPNFPIVSTLDNKKEVSNLLGWLHGNAALMLALLAGGHALAALKHHFVDRDDVLLRMLPRPCAKALNRLRGASMRLFLLLFLFAFAFPGAASAADWQIDPAHSKLGFTGTQNGEKFDGGFKKFDAQISLDPDHPETGHIAVTVDMTTAYAGSDDRDQMLPQAAWFDSKKFPQAHFVSTAIRKTGNARYEADATLTIKGITRNVLLPFTLAPEGDHWRAQGTTQLIRSDFQIGQGSFSSEAYVKHAVDVAIDLAAKPLP